MAVRRHTRRSGFLDETTVKEESEKCSLQISNFAITILLLGRSWAVYGPVSNRKMNLRDYPNYPSVSGTVKPIIRRHRDSWGPFTKLLHCNQVLVKGVWKTILNRIDKELLWSFMVRLMFTFRQLSQLQENHVI